MRVLCLLCEGWKISDVLSGAILLKNLKTLTLRLAIIFVTAASVLLFMTFLINKIDKIVIQCKSTTRVYFWHFLAYVSCRISRTSGGSPLYPPPTRDLLRNSKRLPPDPQLQGGHCTLCLQDNIHTSCNLQTTDSGKNISILMKKLREKWVEIIKTQGK